MSSWHRFFVIVLLVLSLPAQSLTAAAMSLGLSHGAGIDAPACAHAEQANATMSSMHPHVASQPRCHSSAAHPCAACTPCCVGALLTGTSHTMLFADTGHAVSFPPFSASAASFLTDGIERPPRLSPI